MTKKPQQIDWHARAATLALRTRAFIDGKYVEARSGETFDCVNPANGKVMAKPSLPAPPPTSTQRCQRPPHVRVGRLVGHAAGGA